MAKATWLEMSIRVPHEYVEPVAALFRRHGEGGVVIEEEAGGFNLDEGEQPPASPSATVRTYLPAASDFRVHRELVHIGISLISHVQPMPPLQEREVSEEEWESAWKAHFTPLHVGERLVVVAPFHAYEPRQGEVVVQLDPGLAFGTGHHPTTRRCLESLERLLKPSSQVADVGCGSAVLSIAAAKLGAGRVVGVDVDDVAVRVALANIQANGVTATVRCYHGTLPHPELKPGSSDLVLANISARALSELAPHLRQAMKPGGWVIASGVLQKQQAQVKEAFAAAGFSIREVLLDDDWVTLLAQ